MAVAVQEVVSGLTPAEKRHLGALEKRIERGMTTFRDVGEALMDIRDHRLYRETHSSFDAYCRERWSFDRGRAYQLIGAAEVARAIPDGFPPIANEAQARELVPVMRENPSVVADIWREVVASDEPISASRVRNIVRQRTNGDHEVPTVSPTTALVGAIDRAVAQVTRWVATRPGRADRDRVREATARLMAAVADV